MIRKITALTPLAFLPSIAYGYSYDRSPIGSGVIDDLQITSTVTQADCSSEPYATEYAIILVSDGLDVDIDYSTGVVTGDGYISPYYPIDTESVSTFSSVEADIYAVGFACHYEIGSPFPDNYYVYQNDFEGDWSNVSFTLEIAETTPTGLILLDSSASSQLGATIGAEAGTSFVSLVPVVSIVIGIVLAVGISKWLVGIFEKSFEKTMRKAEKASEEYHDIVDR